VLRTAVKWGHVQDNSARGVDLPTLKTVRPKWVLTTTQATADVILNVYAQVMDDSLRTAVDGIGKKLFTKRKRGRS